MTDEFMLNALVNAGEKEQRLGKSNVAQTTGTKGGTAWRPISPAFGKETHLLS